MLDSVNIILQFR